MIPEVKERRESKAVKVSFRYSEGIGFLLPDPGLIISESATVDSSNSDTFL